MHKAITRFLLAGGLTLLALPATALDLKQAYELALRNDPTLREAEANYLAAKEAKPQAWAAYLPQLDLGASLSTTDADGTDTQFFGTVQSFAFDTTRETTSYGVTLRQTIFSWDRIRAIGQAGAEVARAEADWQAAQQSLLVRTAEAYFNLLAAQDSLESARANREAIGRQLEQSKKRFEVGLIAVTDVQESQAAYDQATADEIAAERSLASTRQRLTEIVGTQLDPNERLEVPQDDMPLATPEPADEKQWVDLAQQQNLSLTASRFNYEAFNAGVGRARSAHLPTVDLEATYGKSDTDFTDNLDPAAPTLPSDSTSTRVTLSLNMPLFAGGADQSRLRQAWRRRDAAEAQLERVMRETQRSARDAYLGVTSEISRVKALRQGLQSSETALKATEAGFEVGTRTTVDVLDARRRMFQAKTNYARSKYDYLLNTLRLKQAAGMLTDADIGRMNDWLQ